MVQSMYRHIAHGADVWHKEHTGRKIVHARVNGAFHPAVSCYDSAIITRSVCGSMSLPARHAAPAGGTVRPPHPHGTAVAGVFVCAVALCVQLIGRQKGRG